MDRSSLSEAVGDAPDIGRIAQYSGVVVRSATRRSMNRSYVADAEVRCQIGLRRAQRLVVGSRITGDHGSPVGMQYLADIV
jgi:hypothetical protein